MKIMSSVLLIIVTIYGTFTSPAQADTYPLFSGQNLSGWVASKTHQKANWKVKEDYLEVVPGTGDIETVATFNDFNLHAEFWIPYLPEKTGQDRGNSGIFLQGRYEIQVLDTYRNETYLDGICGALYKLIAPTMNASLPPETWQTYDISFKSPRLDNVGHVVEKGEVSVILNGHLVIDRGQFERGTGSAAKYPQGVPGPIRLQDHGSAVRFRNLTITY